MKIPKYIKYLGSGLLLFSSLSAQTTVATDPVGYKNLTITGNNGLTLLGIEFLGEAEFHGQVTGVTSNSISVDGVNFDDLLDTSSSYALEITSDSDNQGVNTLVTSWSGSVLNLGDDLSGLLNINSDTVKVFRLSTISEVFDGVLNGGSATTADLIYMPNPEGAGLITIYYSNGGFPGVGWRQAGAGSADKSNLPIYFSDGLYILKRSSGDANITVSGTVKLTSTKLVLEQGFTPFSTVYPAGTTLVNSGLYDPSAASDGIVAGSPVTADLVYTDSDNDGNIEIYYYSLGGFAGVGWRQAGGGSADRADVNLGSGFGILKRSNTNNITISRAPAY